LDHGKLIVKGEVKSCIDTYNALPWVRTYL
jgi:hypothetical protein